MTDFTRPEAYLEARRENAEAAIASAITAATGADRLERALLPYQQRAVMKLETGVNVLVIEKSRRIGMTWGLAAAAVLRAARRRTDGGMDWLYISYSQEMTREFIDACAMWARLFQIAAGDAEEYVFEDEKEGEETRSIKAFRISFASGFEIVGLSSAPRSLRGRQGVVMIDEYAFVDDPDALMKSALALLMWGGQVIVCSTHNGADNPFNQLIRDIHLGKLNYAHMKVDFDQALAEGLYRRICQVKGTPWTAEGQKAWRDGIVADYGDAADEELFCIPSQGAGTWLPVELIERQMKHDAGERPILRWTWEADYLTWDQARQQKHLTEKLRELDLAMARLNPRHRHALGGDFGRFVDLTVLTLLEIDDLLARHEALTIEMRNAPFQEQQAIIECLWQGAPRRAGAALDARGLGHALAEAIARRFGTYDLAAGEGGEIAGVMMSTRWYAEEMPKLKDALEQGQLDLIRDDDHLGDLRLVKLVKGVPTIPDVRKGAAGVKRHGDFAVALGLAWFATLMNTTAYGYDSAAAREGSPRDDFNTPPSARDGFRTGDYGGIRGGFY